MSSISSTSSSKRSVEERMESIAAFIDTQERCAADLNARLASLHERVADLAHKLNGINHYSAAATRGPLHAGVLYPPERGLPTATGRMRRLARQQGLAKLAIPDSKASSSSSSRRSKHPAPRGHRMRSGEVVP
jgi:hypothetical protein